MQFNFLTTIFKNLKVPKLKEKYSYGNVKILYL